MSDDLLLPNGHPEFRAESDRILRRQFEALIARQDWSGFKISDRFDFVAKQLYLIKMHCKLDKLDDTSRTNNELLVLRLLQYLAATFNAALVTIAGPVADPKLGTSDRLRLRQWLDAVMSAIIPQSQRGRELVLVPMPAVLAKQLLEALEALDAGEVPDMLAPLPTDRKSTPYSLDKAHARSVQHVAFLTGQGIPKGQARRRVGAVLGVSVETIRGWERKHRCVIERAVEAGRIEALASDGVPIPKHIVTGLLHTLTELRAEPLAAFGAEFRKTFGSRHRQVVAE